MRYVTNLNDYLSLYFNEYLDVNKLAFAHEDNLDYLLEQEIFDNFENWDSTDKYCLLADLCYNGKYLTQNHARAMELYDIGISKDSVYCMYKKANILIDSKDLEYEEAFTLLSKASDLGYAPAINTLGWMYSRGLGCKLDTAKAFELYKKASSLGSKTAMVNYAKMLLENDEYEEGFKYLNKAANLKSVYAYITLGYLYYYGKYIDVNYEKAYEYYRLAALEDDSIAFKYLAEMYRYGYHVSKDIAMATFLYKESIRLGYDNSKRELARMLIENE